MASEPGASPPTLAVLTPSYGPDLDLCRELNHSVLASSPPDVHHHIIVPRRDERRFAAARGPRTHVAAVDGLLPTSMRGLPGTNLWVNLRRPWPPVRGWVMQQIVKLRAAALLGAELILLADSDVLLVRPVSSATLLDQGLPRFYRAPGAVHAGMPEHRRWHDVARRLLGLPASPAGPLNDYVSPFNLWTRTVVLALCEHLEHVNGRPWVEVLAAELTFSEFILYGVFVDEVLGSAAPLARTDKTLCHSYWPCSPLDGESAAKFATEMQVDDVALMVSAKSRTPLAVRRALRSRIPIAPPLVEV